MGFPGGDLLDWREEASGGGGLGDCWICILINLFDFGKYVLLFC